MHDLDYVAGQVVEHVTDDPSAVDGRQQGSLSRAISEALVWQEAQDSAVGPVSREHFGQAMPTRPNLPDLNCHNRRYLLAALHRHGLLPTQRPRLGGRKHRSSIHEVVVELLV
jgi:hypothetical protein